MDTLRLDQIAGTVDDRNYHLGRRTVRYQRLLHCLG